MAQAYEYQIVEDSDTNIATSVGTADADGWEVTGAAYEGVNGLGVRQIGVLMKRRLQS